MPIPYYLQDNPATPDPNDQTARVATKDNLGEDYLATQMVRRGVFPTAGASVSALKTIQEIIAEAVADGFAINLDLCTIRAGIGGVFTDEQDSFDPARHVLRANFYTGTLLEEKLATASVEKIDQRRPSPYLKTFINQNTGARNAILTPGGIGQLLGGQLKYGAQDAEGIYAVNTATGVATRVTQVARKTEGELLFIIPALAAGTYRLEVRRYYGGNLDQMRDGRLIETLTVA